MTEATITGDEEIDRRLIHLSQKGATRAARKSVNKGMKVIEKGIRAAAPVGKTQGLRKAVGTAKRFRKKIGGKFARFDDNPASSKATGATPANDFVKRGFQGAESAAAAVSVDTLDVEIQKEAAKAS